MEARTLVVYLLAGVIAVLVCEVVARLESDSFRAALFGAVVGTSTWIIAEAVRVRAVPIPDGMAET